MTDSVGSRTRKLGEITLGLARSTNSRTADKLVWAARNSTGLPALVHVMKAISLSDWGNAKWSVVRKGSDAPYPQSAKITWQALDRRRMLLAGTHDAVFEVVLPEPTINDDTKAFFPIRLKCVVAGLEILSKPFFVLATDAIGSLTKLSLQKLDEWFLDPNMGLSSVVQQSVVRSKSLAAAFLRRHTQGVDGEGGASGMGGSKSVYIADDAATGVRARFMGAGNATVRAIEKMYPVPVPMDDAHLLIAVSQIFHFTHESIQWVGDQATTEMLFAYNAAMVPNVYSDFGKDHLHVYGSIVPLKGMYQHSNPRLKIPFEVMCNALKVILAANGLPKRWVENDGRALDLTDAQVRERQFYTYEAVFGNANESVFNVNRALEALAKSVSVNRNGALCLDYSVVIPVLVNSLSELNAFFAETKSRLRSLIGNCTDQLFAAQTVVAEIGAEIAAMHEERSANEQAQLVDGGLVFKHMAATLKERYLSLPLHLTQAVDVDCFVPPTFDLFETGGDKENERSDTALGFAELLQSDLTVCRLCIRGAPGAGKTTLCRFIAREWARGRAVFSGKFDLVMYLSLDAATTSTYTDLAQVSLADLVMREVVQQNADLRDLVADKEELVAWLAQNSGRILWVLDGVDALEEYADNLHNAAKAPAPDAPDAAGTAAHNVRHLLRAIEQGSASGGATGDVESQLAKNRVVTAALGSNAAIVADLYLSVRPFDNAAVREYLAKFFPSSEESGTEQEISGDLEEQSRRLAQVDSAAGADENKSGSPVVVLSGRASKIWMSLEKNKMLAREIVHVPFNLELICASYQSDPQFHLLPEHTLADLYGRFYRWLLSASGTPEQSALLEKHVQKIAYSVMFRSKFASPTLVSKVVNQVPREFRAAVVATRFFEGATYAGKGLRFIHPRVTQYLTARYLADPHEDRFSVEVLSRLKAKVISRAFHPVYLFLVGLVRHDRARLGRLFDLVLLDDRELGLLGAKGPTFVFRCFEETGFDRAIRSRVIDWFWLHFGKPRMAMWRSSYVVNLLELIIFKLTKKPSTVAKSDAGAGESAAAAAGPDPHKSKAVRALGSLGVESSRVVQMLVKCAQQYPDLLPDVVLTVQEISTTSLSVIPLLLEALKSRTPAELKVAIAEIRRMIVPSAIEKSSGGSKTVDAAAGKLVKIGMDWIDEDAGKHLVQDVLATLDQWGWGDDRVLPLLVNALEHADVDVRRAAVVATKWVNLNGPNVYYNDKLVGLLEHIGRQERALRVEVMETFLALAMDTEYVRELVVSTVSQTEDAKMQRKAMMLCGQYRLRQPRVIDAVSKIALASAEQETRRQAIDVLAYVFLPDFNVEKRTSPEEMQQHINSVVDTLYSLGLSSQFVTHRVVRMADKKSKSAHIAFSQFAVKYF